MFELRLRFFPDVVVQPLQLSAPDFKLFGPLLLSSRAHCERKPKQATAVREQAVAKKLTLEKLAREEQQRAEQLEIRRRTAEEAAQQRREKIDSLNSNIVALREVPLTKLFRFKILKRG